jgi:hypothetical protein
MSLMEGPGKQTWTRYDSKRILERIWPCDAYRQTDDVEELAWKKLMTYISSIHKREILCGYTRLSLQQDCKKQIRHRNADQTTEASTENGQVRVLHMQLVILAEQAPCSSMARLET